jgi:hypothetical protein
LTLFQKKSARTASSVSISIRPRLQLLNFFGCSELGQYSIDWHLYSWVSGPCLCSQYCAEVHLLLFWSTADVSDKRIVSQLSSQEWEYEAPIWHNLCCESWDIQLKYKTESVFLFLHNPELFSYSGPPCIAVNV